MKSEESAFFRALTGNILAAALSSWASPWIAVLYQEGLGMKSLPSLTNSYLFLAHWYWIVPAGLLLIRCFLWQRRRYRARVISAAWGTVFLWLCFIILAFLNPLYSITGKLGA